MIGPEVLSGMKQPHDFAAVAVDGRDIAAFAAVAQNARVGQVFDDPKGRRVCG